jgi:carbonic anhydrase
LIFDASLGELFVVRVAGNVLSPEVAGSLQYAGSHLETPLFVVLGHEGCGAISAALAANQGRQFRSHVQQLLTSIIPALADPDERLSPERQLSVAVEENVRGPFATCSIRRKGRLGWLAGARRSWGRFTRSKRVAFASWTAKF